MTNREPPGGGGGGGDEPLAMSHLRCGQGMKVSLLQDENPSSFTRKGELQTPRSLSPIMRRKEPLEVDATWRYPLPMPMPGQPVCATVNEATEQIERLGNNPKLFLWTDFERKCPENWDFIASVRQGVPPQGIEAELKAWAKQYPHAWLAVDLRDGVIPPSTATDLNQLLRDIKRYVIVIVSRSSDHEDWPQWVLPA